MVNFPSDLHSGKQIFLNSNESVFGPSANVASAIRSSLDQVERYPENASASLARALSARFNHPAAQIVCGHGSDDLLARLSRAYLAPGDELVYSRNGYPKIPNYAYVNDAIPVACCTENKSPTLKLPSWSVLVKNTLPPPPSTASSVGSAGVVGVPG